MMNKKYLPCEISKGLARIGAWWVGVTVGEDMICEVWDESDRLCFIFADQSG